MHRYAPPVVFLGCLTVASIAAVRAWADKPAFDVSKLPPAAETKVDFARDVQPLLAERCTKCHGRDKHESGLRLHAKEDAFAGGDSGPAIVPGKSAESRLIQFVSGLDPDAKMPPADAGEPLSAAQVSLLRAWIDQGAVWPESADDAATRSNHWAYKKPVRPAVPAVKQAAWPKNPIDAFVLARLEAAGLAPSPESDRATLIRRLSLDLTGLPPTPEEIDAFVADQAPNAFEKVVDRLLASPRYGERWARLWLDLARYADTHGYEKDPSRSMWPYRDWVIDAFNKNLPFDQFTIEQIAGDLLPNATLDQRIATGFHRNTMINTEGGTDDEEFRVAAIVDRVNTTGTVWLGATIACAQCHSHKYDPFKQREYYQLSAFFNSTVDTGHNDAPQIDVRRRVFGPQQAEAAALDAKVDTPTPELAASQMRWEASGWKALNNLELAATSGATATKQPDGSLTIGGATAENDTYTIKAKTDLSGITAIRLEALTDPSLPGQGPGRSASGGFILSEFRLSAAQAGGPAAPIELQNPWADHSQEGWDIAAATDGNPTTGWAIGPELGKPHNAIWETKTDLTPADGTLTVTLDHQRGMQQSIGHFRLWVATAPRPAKHELLPTAIDTILAIPAEGRSEPQRNELAAYYRGIAPELQATRDRLEQLRPGLPKSGKTYVMGDLPQPRQTFIHVRGNFMVHGDPVSAGVPAVLNPMPSGEPLNRLGLARWLVSKDNPLTARVAVNRFWEQYFGSGIVLTSEDFGTQGDPPSHLELLDWLATEFMDRGWDMKALHKLIVMSATYRQTSQVPPAMVEHDPANRLLARGPRVRLEAEMIRDQALAVSGLLSAKIGGPSVMPPLPEGLLLAPYSGEKWVISPGVDRYRRGLYTFWRRTSPYPSFMSFDAPSREFCVVRRSRSNTPLQALDILNDPVYVEAAQGLARRIMSTPTGAAEDRAVYGFRLCLARGPQPAERDRLLGLFNQELEHFRNDRAAAEQLAGKGSEPGIPPNMDPAELAAWTVVANVLLNLDETITKG